eukprot:GFUD01069313.1.p1 GENE.GFUD01069313.1~~GFUD01069313.1.p1  ORF type:complete len:638 (-),score=186.96 GFUD01069313.1:307-2220(-)
MADSMGPLPAGWEKKFDSRTNKYYYLNHYTKTTSWEFPRVSNQQIVMPVMPTENQNPNMDDSNNPLPAGWSKKFDPGSGKHFYCNHFTQKTTWEVPTEEYQQAGQSSRPSNQQIVRPVIKNPKPTTTDDSNNPLPAGWSKKFDAGSGKYFYCNHYTQKTTWEVPTEEHQQPRTPATKDKENQRPEADTESMADSENTLPPGWGQKYDPRTGKFFYMHHATRKTTWEFPTEKEDQEPNPPEPKAADPIPLQVSRSQGAQLLDGYDGDNSSMQMQPDMETSQPSQPSQTSHTSGSRSTFQMEEQGGSDKSRYLKSVFPTAEEFLILDVLANSGNNVQKAADRLVKMGYVKKDPLAAPSTITENEKMKLRKKMKDKYENEFGIHETILFMALESSNYNEEQATNFVKSMIENMQQDKEVEKIRERDEKMKSKKIAEAEKIKLQKNAEAEKIKLQKIAEAEKIKSQKTAEAEKIKLQKITEAEKLKSQKTAAAEKIKSQKIAEAKHPKQTSPKNVPRPSSPRTSKGTNTQEKRSEGEECKTNAKGPNPALRKGPNDALLLTDYVNWNGPNPELKRGPNPTGAQGPNLEFRQGPSGCSTGPNALNRKGSSSIAKGPNPDSRKGPNDDLLLTEYDSWNGPIQS